MTLDLDSDLAYVDGVAAATLRLKRPSGVVEVAVATAVPADLSRALKAFGGLEIAGDETAWELPDGLPAGATLSPDDEIVTAGSTYVVVSARRLPLDAGWSAVVRPRRGGV